MFHLPWVPTHHILLEWADVSLFQTSQTISDGAVVSQATNQGWRVALNSHKIFLL